MPYQVIAERPPYRYISIVPRRKLASAIIEQLIALNFSLNDFKRLIQSNHLSSFHILSDADYRQLIAQHPEMDFIYSEAKLKDQTKIHYHTNWTVSPKDWQSLSAQLKSLGIEVQTLKQPDSFITIRRKEPL